MSKERIIQFNDLKLETQSKFLCFLSEVGADIDGDAIYLQHTVRSSILKDLFPSEKDIGLDERVIVRGKVNTGWNIINMSIVFPPSK